MPRGSYTPFEDLTDFKMLSKFIVHILNSIKIEEISVIPPSGFDENQLRDPRSIIPIREILVGHATYNYIEYKAPNLFIHLENLVAAINQDESLSIADRKNLFKDVLFNIQTDYPQFDSRNKLKYSTDVRWKVKYSKEQSGRMIELSEDYPASKLALSDAHWAYIDNTIAIRKTLLDDISFKITQQVESIETNLSRVKYTWQSNDRYDVYELLYAIISSNKVDFGDGNEHTFAHHFLALFGKDDKDLATIKRTVLKRKNLKLLGEMADSLERYARVFRR